MAPIDIGPLGVPDSLESPEARDFIASSDLANLIQRDLWGHDDHGEPVAARLRQARDTRYLRMLLWAATEAGVHVGWAVAALPLTDNVSTAYVGVGVHPDHRGRGIGSRLLAVVEHAARERGRTTVMGWNDNPAGFDVDAAGVLRPSSGAGSVPRDAGPVRFAVRHGYALEQVERFSLVSVPVDDDLLARLRADAEGHVGGEYDLVMWQQRCPESYLDAYAALRMAIGQDVPMGGLSAEAQQWDAARVRHGEEESIAKGTDARVAAVRHVASGELIGHTILERDPSRPEVAYQEDTLVLRAHRGRRLGMWMKTLNLARAQEDWPTIRRLYTWNAAENGPMLGINTALGFTPAGYEAAWQKRLT